MPKIEQSTLPSLERMNPKIEPTDPLGMVNYCLYGYSDSKPIFFTRSERQKIEDFLHYGASDASFTLQSGEVLSREEIQERLRDYEKSIYRSTALNRITFALDASIVKLEYEKNKNELQEKVTEFFTAYTHEVKQQEIEHAPLLREAVGEFLSQHPNSPANKELEKAVKQYDEQYGERINSENVGEAARTLLNVVEALGDEDMTIAAFKEKVIRISYNINSPETMQKIRNVLMLAQQLLKKEGVT